MLITIKDIVKDILQLFWGRKKYKFALKDWLRLPDLLACSRVIQTMRFTNNLQPVELKYPAAKRILVIAPHPDDEIIGPGGTLIKSIIWNNADVKVLYLSTTKETGEEALTVSRALDYDVCFQPRDLHKEIREYNPDCLFIPSFFDDHIDHRNANKLLLYLKYRNIDVWAYQVYSTILPNIVVDITMERSVKARAIRGFKSQSKHRDWAHYTLGLNAFNVRFLKTTKPRYAETFFVVPLWEYIKLCEVYFDR